MICGDEFKNAIESRIWDFVIFIKFVTRIEAYCVCAFVTLVMLVCNSGGGILTNLSEVSENDVPERQARMCHGVTKFSPN